MRCTVLQSLVTPVITTSLYFVVFGVDRATTDAGHGVFMRVHRAGAGLCRHHLFTNAFVRYLFLQFIGIIP